MSGEATCCNCVRHDVSMHDTLPVDVWRLLRRCTPHVSRSRGNSCGAGIQTCNNHNNEQLIFCKSGLCGPSQFAENNNAHRLILHMMRIGRAKPSQQLATVLRMSMSGVRQQWGARCMDIGKKPVRSGVRTIGNVKSIVIFVDP